MLSSVGALALCASLGLGLPGTAVRESVSHVASGVAASASSASVGLSSSIMPVYYYFKNKNSGMCLTVGGDRFANGAPIIQMPCSTGNVRQLWFLKGTAGLPRPMLSLGSGKCLNVPGARFVNGNGLIQYQCSGLDVQNEVWRFDATTIRTFGSKCASVDHSSRASGARVLLWSCRGMPAQVWQRTVG